MAGKGAAGQLDSMIGGLAVNAGLVSEDGTSFKDLPPQADLKPPQLEYADNEEKKTLAAKYKINLYSFYLRKNGRNVECVMATPPSSRNTPVDREETPDSAVQYYEGRHSFQRHGIYLWGYSREKLSSGRILTVFD